MLEAVVLIVGERSQHGDDRFPRVCAPGDGDVAADLASESILPADSLSDLESVRRCITRDRRAVVNTQVLREAGRHDSGVHLCDFPRSDIGARLGQHLEPHAETIGVELLVPARPGRTPEVQIEDALQLFGRSQGDELAAVFESASLDHTMDQLRLESRDDAGEVRRAQDAIEQTLRFSWTTSQIKSFGHVEWTTMPRKGADR